jgi:V-type H+-transporting ATPase subunit e
MTGLYTGSIIFAILGLLACVGMTIYVGKNSKDNQSRTENRLMTIVVVTMCTFCMWLQWICAYMHQMNPITPPVPEHGSE